MIWLLGYGMAFAGLRLSRVDFRHISCLLLFVICIMYRDRDRSRGRARVGGGSGVKLLLFFCFLSLGSSYSALLSVEIFVAAALSVSIAKPFRLSSNLWPFCVLWLFVCSFFLLFSKASYPPLPPFPSYNHAAIYVLWPLTHTRTMRYNVYKCVLIYDPPPQRATCLTHLPSYLPPRCLYPSPTLARRPCQLD